MAKKAAAAPVKAVKAAKKPAAKKAAKAVAKAPAKAGATKAAATVTLKHIAAELATEHEVSKKQAEGMLTGMIDLVVKNLKKGQRVRLVGLGILQVKKPVDHGRWQKGGCDPTFFDQISKFVQIRARHHDDGSALGHDGHGQHACGMGQGRRRQ